MTRRILFITSTRIGDAILSMGILGRLVDENPHARFTIVCGSLPASLFEGVPRLEKIIILNKKSFRRHWFDLWREVIATRWDSVVDLRNSAVSRLIRARQRLIFGSHIPQHLHKAKQNALVMGYDDTPTPRLFITDEQMKMARELIPDGSKVLGIGPTANWVGKTWPRENFVRLIKKLTDEGCAFHNWRVAIFAAPREEEDARYVLASVPELKAIDMIAKTNPGTAAACLARCHFYIGNDSGLMHAAAAAGIPTLGLFGASYVDIYGPFGGLTATAHTPQTYDEIRATIPNFDPKNIIQSLMKDLRVTDVERSVLRLAERAGLFVI